MKYSGSIFLPQGLLRDCANSGELVFKRLTSEEICPRIYLEINKCSYSGCVKISLNWETPERWYDCDLIFIILDTLSSSSSIGQSRPIGGKDSRAGSYILRSYFIYMLARGYWSRDLGQTYGERIEVMMFGVSRRAPTDPFKEVMICWCLTGVSSPVKEGWRYQIG